ncbi:MAG TPA: S-layer homology domain-containing protein [Acidimicrobiales bacterium]
MRVRRPIVIGSLVVVLSVGAVAPSAGADTVTDDGVAWLTAQQRPNGGFEVAGFDGFETPDAILAIAANAQTTAIWSTAEALAAVEAVDNAGVTALDWVDAWVDGELTDPPLIGQEAKLILQVAGPLGFDPTDFDPGDDDAPGDGVDLTAGLDENAPALFNSFLFARLAESRLGQNVHQADLQVMCESEKATGGGWSFDGDPAGPNSADLDTTGFAVMALVAAGVDPSAPVLEAAETFVLGGQVATGEDAGAWQSFGSPDPNATALAMFAVTALGTGLDDLAHDPVAWLQSQQLASPPADDGRFASPNDGFGVNTFATSQAVQALLLDQVPGADWLPVAPQVSTVQRRCLPEAGFADVPVGAWYDDGARWVDDVGIVGGINGDLRPAGRVNRAQAAMWLNDMFGGPGGAPHSFTDVPDGAWYEDGVDFVGGAPNGVIATGFGDQFRPRLNLNRAQAASWLYAAADSPDVTGLPAHGFTDVGPSTWYGDAATWAAANEIVLGFGDDTFRGDGNVSRAQFAQWMFNLVATPEAWTDGATLPPTLLFSVFS